MNGVTRETLIAFIVTVNPKLGIVLLLIAALVALGLIALFPRQRTWQGMTVAFFVYWLVLLLILLVIIQGVMGRQLITFEYVPFEAENFGLLFYGVLTDFL